MDSVPLKFQRSLLATGDCLVADVSYVFGGIAADEDFLAVAEVAGFGDELVNFRVIYCTEFLVVRFAHFWV
jgi:hypothetical protein